MTLLVRTATHADVEALAELRAEMDAEEGVLEPSGFRTEFESWFRVSSHGWTALIAKDGDAVVGTLWISFLPRVPRPSERVAAPIAHLTNFFVRTHRRNAGVGSALLEEARARATAAGAELVLVWRSDRAVPLYERHGYAMPGDLLELRLP